MQRSSKKLIPALDQNALNELSASHNNYLNVSHPVKLQLAALGNVYYQDNKFYFDVTNDSRKCAKTFLSIVINTPAVCDLINEGLKNKQADLCPAGGVVTPNCISFVTGSCDGKSVCFIAVSGISNINYDKSKLMYALNDIANNLNMSKSVRNEKYHYAVIQESSPKFREHMYQMTGSARYCTENEYGAILAKMNKTYGDKFKVEGIVNCAFFVFESNIEISYQRGYNGKKTLQLKNNAVRSDVASEYESGEKLTVTNSGKTYHFSIMPCCQVCKQNKNAFMSTLIHFQQLGNNSNQDLYSQAFGNKSSLSLSQIKEASNRSTSMYAFLHAGECIEDTNERPENKNTIARKTMTTKVINNRLAEFDAQIEFVPNLGRLQNVDACRTPLGEQPQHSNIIRSRSQKQNKAGTHSSQSSEIQKSVQASKHNAKEKQKAHSQAKNGAALFNQSKKPLNKSMQIKHDDSVETANALDDDKSSADNCCSALMNAIAMCNWLCSSADAEYSDNEYYTNKMR